MMPPNAAPVQSGSAVVFEDKASLALKSELDRLAPSDASLLLVGETGTGKNRSRVTFTNRAGGAATHSLR